MTFSRSLRDHPRPDKNSAWMFPRKRLEARSSASASALATRRPSPVKPSSRRGAWRTVSNPGDVAARYLVALTPSGYEFYFERLAALVRNHGSMPDKETLVRLMAEHETFLAKPA